MRNITFSESGNWPVAILVKPSALNQYSLRINYLDYMESIGISEEEVIAYDLEYGSNGKANAKMIHECLTDLLVDMKDVGVQYIYVTDPAYFKALTKSPKADVMYGYVLPCAVKGYEDMHVVLGVNYQVLFHKPNMKEKLEGAFDSIVAHLNGSYKVPGTSIVAFEEYPKTNQEISKWLEKLYKEPELALDIEAFSLKFWETTVATMTMCWSQHKGIAFPVESEEVSDTAGNFELRFKYNPVLRIMLREFFENYKGKVIWHNSPYDLKVFIHMLWMEDLSDIKGLLKGLHIMCKNMEDTKIIAYLALNSTTREAYGLKLLSQEFTGNYALEEISDIRHVRMNKLLKYNLIDGLATFYVYNRYKPVMIEDLQEEIYESLMKPSLKTIIQMELHGMPIDLDKVKKLKAELERDTSTITTWLYASKTIQDFTLMLQENAADAKNKKLKKKRVTAEDFDGLQFNPGSGNQVQLLLYEFMGLPVLDKTDSGAPATGGDTLKKLVNHATDPEHIKIIGMLRELTGMSKILSAFIPAFLDAVQHADGYYYVHGSFNLGGTVSGRLSSSDPNMQNIPANSKYGKAIKECFMAVSGWLFGGADFNSLEDYISALTTRDPNKLKVYTDGFDGHCLRAAYYYSEQLPDIDPLDPTSVNSIADKYAHLRQESKTPTFALTYQGTYITLMQNLGWDEAKAKRVEAMYHKLYAASKKYIDDRITQAAKDGYAAVAFGLRVRTPMLKQVVWGSNKVPYQAKKEARTVGNAMGQSYCLLNNRALNEFMEAVWASPYALDIYPVALIHDAIYLVFRDDPDVVEFVNSHLVKAMQWQELPEIQHPTVKIGAALDIFYPSWAKGVGIPNYASKAEIIKLCEEHFAKL